MKSNIRCNRRSRGCVYIGGSAWFMQGPCRVDAATWNASPDTSYADMSIRLVRRWL